MAYIDKYQLKNGQEKYLVKYYCGIDETTGKKIFRMKRGFNTKKEASDYAEAQRVYIREHGLEEEDRKPLTYEDLHKLWLEEYRHEVKESTFQKSLEMFNNHILPRFGDKVIDKITPVMCKRAVNDWHKDLVNYRQVFGAFSRIFKYGIRNGLVSENPCEKITIPKKRNNQSDRIIEVTEDEYWTREELALFLEGCKEDVNSQALPLFRLLAYTGMRRGEALALTWEDIDFKENTVSITKTMSIGLNNQPIIQSPKSNASKRILPLDGETMQILKVWKMKQMEDLFILGHNALGKDQLVFTNTKNAMMSLNMPRDIMIRVCNQKGLRRIKVHGLRHTHATLLLMAGASVQEVQDRLGHSNYSITMDIYAHLTQETKKETASRFAQYMSV